MNEHSRSLHRQARLCLDPQLFCHTLLVLGLLLTVSLQPAMADWPEYRGPFGDGHASAPGDTKSLGVPLSWSETNNIQWKTEIPFRGWSTPVAMDGQIWLTTATEDGHDFFAVQVDAKTGAVKLNEKLFHSDAPEPLGNGASMNGYATPSPFIEPGRVFVHFGRFGTACLDTRSGKVLWKREDIQCRHYRGAASSVIGFQNAIILTMDGVDVQYLLALDKSTGTNVWKTERSVAWNDENVPGPMARDGDLRKAHSTPFVVRDSGSPLMLSAGAKAAYGYDPRTGRELWRVQYNDWSAAPRPVFHQGLAFFVTGFTKHQLLAVKADGSGDVTGTHIAWKSDRRVGVYASPIIVDGLLYDAAEENYVTCIEASSGQVVWSEKIGGKYAASPIYADGRLYFCSQQGVTTVLKPGRTFSVLATNTLAGSFMACPAVEGRALILRTKTHLYRVENLNNP